MDAIRMIGIVKCFGPVRANDGIDLIVGQQEIHCLLGENGTGKSTLMNILFGLYHPDAGEIFINEKKAAIANPNDAYALGIGMVHQHFKLVDNFTVTENIILGCEPRKGLTVDIKTAAKKIEELSKQYGLNVDPYAKIENISVLFQYNLFLNFSSKTNLKVPLVLFLYLFQLLKSQKKAYKDKLLPLPLN